MARRPLNRIAAEIVTDWVANSKKGERPHFMRISWPYLEAMLEMDDIAKPYGLEEGVFVVLYFLNNTTYWRGETARRIKAELLQQVKEYNDARDHSTKR